MPALRARPAVTRRLAGLRRAVTALGVLLAVLTLPVAAVAGTPRDLPTAQHVPGIATVGPIFKSGLAQPHSCTASVLLSPGHDLLLTAAHCVSGSGAGLLFAPGYDRGATPYGVWRTTEAYVDPSWLSDQDPQHDYAILRVAHQSRQGRSVGVQDVVGGGELIGLAAPTGQRLSAPGYPAGIDDQPIDCAAPAYRTAGYPSFDCAGYFGGTSGSPWLVPIGSVSLVVGVIGGLHQGGCVDYTSYSSAFSLDTYRLWLRAALGRPADRVPAAGSDGC